MFTGGLICTGPYARCCEGQEGQARSPPPGVHRILKLGRGAVLTEAVQSEVSVAGVRGDADYFALEESGGGAPCEGTRSQSEGP